MKLLNKISVSFSLGILGLLVFFYSACSSGNIDISGPSDIQLSITIQGADENNPNGDGSGIITCITTAKNAVRYAYKFDGGALQESTDGTIEYTFLKKGINTYSVLVFAYSSTGENTNKTLSVKVLQSEKTTGTLMFSDEFNIDGPVDSDKWLFETIPPNNGSWWNDEKQHYTDRLDNAYVSDGSLKIVAKKEQYTIAGSTKRYTSTRLNSKFNFTYGKIDVKAKLPQGMGTWPAIWTLGSSITTVGWPACGEIDIMEHVGNDPNEVRSSIHTPSSNGATINTSAKTVEMATSAFHIYSVNWSANEITFLIDDEICYTYKPSTKDASTWPFDANQFLILNVAMGGSLGGNIPDEFQSSSMEIDYVRVYQ